MGPVPEKSENPEQRCRLCGGTTSFRFAEMVLQKYPVSYWHCDACSSMQTDRPHWLEESYRSVHSATDTGIVARNLQMTQAVSALMRLARIGGETQCLDWGGGNGLFCRMMRDQGFNYFNYDRYAQPFYCAGFSAEPEKLESVDVVTSFEVFEHLAEPKAELSDIVRMRPKLWIFSTQLYEEQEKDWKYFGANIGRHVFFYSDKALRQFAGANGLEFVRGRYMHMFVPSGKNPFRSAIARRLAHRIVKGERFATHFAALHYLVRQRRAYLYWQGDSDRIRRATRVMRARLHQV